MQARRTVLALAAVSAVAVAASALAHGPGFDGMGFGAGAGMGTGFGPGSGAMLNPAVHAERVQSQLEALKGALKLQPAQVAAWNAYEAKVKEDAQARARLHQAMFDNRGDAQAVADQRVTMKKHNAQAADEINSLRKALHASLNDEQKAVFDQYSVGPRFAAGTAGAQRGVGPGYGPRGGRGPGFGRGGCLGVS